MTARLWDWLIRVALVTLLLVALVADGLFYGVPSVQRYGALIWGGS